ncbi:MAG: TIGR02757 family protein [Nitrospiria bacterium]
MISGNKRLGLLLDAFYRKASPIDRIKEDPIEIPHRYTYSKDIEAVGFLSAALAYGRVEQFKKAIDKILVLTDGRPYRYLRSFDLSRERPRFQGIYYRLNSTEDLLGLVYLISRVVDRYGTLGRLFTSLYREEEEDIGPTLSRFVSAIYRFDVRPVYGKNRITAGLRQLLPTPGAGSACKRLNLFLRWMIRPSDGIDFGLWNTISPAKLIIPLDTHIVRIARYLGLTARRSPDWKMAKEITESLKRFDPIDPLKYDFPLCHLGISGDCPIERSREKCRVCPLLGACKRGIRFVKRKDYLPT